MKTLLITGTNGFIGHSCAHFFYQKGYRIVGCGRGENNLSYLTEYLQGDITINLLSRLTYLPDLIIHCAGSGSVAQSMQHPLKDFNDTVNGTAQLLEFSRLNCPEAHIVYLSSPAVHGLHDETAIKTTDAFNPASQYGYHKMMAELLCTSYQENFSLRTTIVRLFSVYGEGLRKQLLWDACNKLIQQECPEFWGTGQETRDWIYIQDVLELLFILVNTSYSTLPKILNCGYGRSYKNSEVIAVLADVLKDSHAFHTLPKFRFNQHARAGDPQHFLADITETAVLCWTPKINMLTGIKQYARWFLTEQAK